MIVVIDLSRHDVSHPQMVKYSHWESGTIQYVVTVSSCRSAPRRSMTTAAPVRPAPPPMAPVPHKPAAASPMPHPGQQGPGMLGQIASTAVGVGIGSAVVRDLPLNTL